MIKISKHGRLVKDSYLTCCPKCDCEFWFDRSDYVGTNGAGVAIKCPECGHIKIGKVLGDIAWTCKSIDEL